MTIYISTGGFKELSADKTSEKFNGRLLRKFDADGRTHRQTDEWDF